MDEDLRQGRIFHLFLEVILRVEEFGFHLDQSLCLTPCRCPDFSQVIFTWTLIN